MITGGNMPYIIGDQKTKKLNDVSSSLEMMFYEFLDTGQAKYLNYVLSRAALRSVQYCKYPERGKYETWRKVKSVLQDVLDEYKHRMNNYETSAKEKNGDVI